MEEGTNKDIMFSSGEVDIIVGYTKKGLIAKGERWLRVVKHNSTLAQEFKKAMEEMEE